ncbi:MAG: winged helix DNA-binding domain-containing protein [Thermoproteota archaeon]
MRGRDAPVRVADACCGIQSQDIRESLSSFWARVDGFSDTDVVSELKPGGSLVRTWAVRSTMHTIPSKDYYIYILGGASERMLKWIDTRAKKRNYPPREERRRLLYEPILDEINGKAVTAKEIRSFMDGKARQLGLREGVWSGLGDMAFSGLLVHAGKRGPNSLWMCSDDWIPRPKTPPDRQTCRVELLRKYIARHGPVSKEDLMYWAYLSKRQLDEALNNIASDLVEVKMKNSREPYIALDQNIEQELPPPPEAIVLPKYDSLMLSLKDKSRFMDMGYYKRIFPKIPVGMVKPTVLLEGCVAATWRRVAKKKAASIEVQPFKKSQPTTRRPLRSNSRTTANTADSRPL